MNENYIFGRTSSEGRLQKRPHEEAIICCSSEENNGRPSMDEKLYIWGIASIDEILYIWRIASIDQRL